MRSLLVTTLFAAMPVVPVVAQPAPVAIETSNFRFTPAVIHLKAGQPARMVFSNASGSSHDFTAREFFRAASGVAGPVHDGEVDLEGHASASVTLTPARGTYRVKCTHFAHKMMGMSATIVVD